MLGPQRETHVTGSFNLLQAVRTHWEALASERQAAFRFHHISTGEVFGSLGPTGRFSETTARPPAALVGQQGLQRPLVRPLHHTNGPWPFPEKLIPVVVVLKAAAGVPIPLHGDGTNVREWHYVRDHVEALLLAATKGRLGKSYCV